MFRFAFTLVVFSTFLNSAFAQKKSDPAATKMLADARAARAVWKNFTGFEADILVNKNGTTVRGQIKVAADGNVTLTLPKNDIGSLPRRQLESLVSHRMFSSRTTYTPCLFGDKNADHPLGRLLLVQNDELHSSYRVRDRQIVEVNRTMKDIRFTITVMENTVNADKMFLPKSYVVNSWNKKSGDLIQSRTHQNTWKRIGDFDLPTQVTIVTATATGLEALQMTLSNHRLGK